MRPRLPPSQKVRAYDFLILSYLTKQQACYFLDNLRSLGHIRYYALIEHSRDFYVDTDERVSKGEVSAGDPKKRHLHIILSCVNARTPSAICRQFNLAGFKDEKGLLAETPWAEPLKNKVGCFDYFTHVKYPSKAQYTCDEIVFSENAENFYSRNTATRQVVDPGEDVSILALKDLLNGASVQSVALCYGKQFIYHYPAFRALLEDMKVFIGRDEFSKVKSDLLLYRQIHDLLYKKNKVLLDEIIEEIEKNENQS